MRNSAAYFTAVLLFLAAVTGCRKEEMPDAAGSVDAPCEQLIIFSVKDAKSPEEVTTESLKGFYVTATSASAATGKETLRWENSYFKRSDKPGRFSGQRVWPSSDPAYRFYASNAKMKRNDDGNPVVTVRSDTLDVVCSYCERPVYGQANELVFEHILARVNNVNVSGLPSEVSDVTVTMEYSETGTYALASGEWSNVEAVSSHSLDVGTDNDLWIIPGTYGVTLSFKDASGKVYSKAKDFEFVAGGCNKVVCIVSEFDIVIGVEYEYEYPDFYLAFDEVLPAGAGSTTKAPEVSNVTQTKFTYDIWTSETRTMKEELLINPQHDIAYSITGENGPFYERCPKLSVESLGKTLTEGDTVAGTFWVKVTANGVSRTKSIDVKRKKNSRSLTSLALDAKPQGPTEPSRFDENDRLRHSSAEAEYAFTLFARYEYDSGATDESAVTVDESFFKGDLKGASFKGNILSIPSRGTTVDENDIERKVTAKYGTWECNLTLTQDQNAVEALTLAQTDYSNLSLAVTSVTPNGQGSSGGVSDEGVTVDCYGATVKLKAAVKKTTTSEKKVYYSHVETGGETEETTETLKGTDVTFTVKAVDSEGAETPDNVLTLSPSLATETPLTVPLWPSTEAERRWHVYVSFAGLTSSPIIIRQTGDDSWDFGGGGSGSGEGEEGEL